MIKYCPLPKGLKKELEEQCKCGLPVQKQTESGAQIVFPLPLLTPSLQNKSDQSYQKQAQCVQMCNRFLSRSFDCDFAQISI